MDITPFTQKFTAENILVALANGLFSIFIVYFITCAIWGIVLKLGNRINEGWQVSTCGIKGVVQKISIFSGCTELYNHKDNTSSTIANFRLQFYPITRLDSNYCIGDLQNKIKVLQEQVKKLEGKNGRDTGKTK